MALENSSMQMGQRSKASGSKDNSYRSKKSVQLSGAQKDLRMTNIPLRSKHQRQKQAKGNEIILYKTDDP